MILTVRPARSLRGIVSLPASKSYSIRAFLIAACGGRSRIVNPSDCDDAKVAVAVARKLGASIAVRKSVWQVKASPKKISSPIINVGESGTVLRFLLPLLALKADKGKVLGEGTLCSRPNFILTQTLRRIGVDIKGHGKKESVPIALKGSRLKGGDMRIDGTLSSQFISALLIALPQVSQNSRLFVEGKMVSASYITMTRQILKKAGIRIGQKEKTFFIKGNQKFRGFKNFIVPSDYGLAAFFLVAACLMKSRIVLRGFLSDDFLQADGQILDLLKRMGAKFRKTQNAIFINGPCRLKGGNFSLKDCPDLVPIMAVAALFAKGKTRLYDIGHVRAKESDRISDLACELLKAGADIREKKDELTIHPQGIYRQNISLDPHRDHRLAMAFAVLGLKIGAKIRDIECTKKSYPKFVRDFKRIVP